MPITKRLPKLKNNAIGAISYKVMIATALHEATKL